MKDSERKGTTHNYASETWVTSGVLSVGAAEYPFDMDLVQEMK